jgi:hypothetical protein
MLGEQETPAWLAVLRERKNLEPQTAVVARLAPAAME